MIAIERRRNMRAENCKACGKLCEAGQGYLYRDTHGRPNRHTGRFGWFVKCEGCSAGNKTRLTVKMEQHAAAHANDPVIRPWSITQVKKWLVKRITHDGDVAIIVEAPTFSEVISYRDRINSSFSAPTGYGLEQHDFAGKPLSDKAAVELSDRIVAIVNAVNREERAAGEAAAAKLTAAGAVVSMHCTGGSWKVEFKGGSYTLWGHVDGTNKMTGLVSTAVVNGTTVGPWIETTAETLIGGTDAI